MEYKEAPGLTQIERRLHFAGITWLDKKKFLERIELGIAVNPHSNDDNGDMIFIGKSIPKVSTQRRYWDGNIGNLQILGTVAKNVTGHWQLNLPYNSGVIEEADNFLVLLIEDQNSFTWVKTSNDVIPKYALRGAIDEQTLEYFYIGRTIPATLPDRENNKVSYYRNGLHEFNESIPALFGKVHTGHKCLYAAHNSFELIFKTYEILCLKASPAPLKILCRSLIRLLADDSNEKIQNINTNLSGSKYLPKQLVEYVKYPSFLAVGEYMLKGEKIVRDDGRFELVIESNGCLVIRSLILDEANKTKPELDNLNLVQVKRNVEFGVESIWLTRFQIVFDKAIFNKLTIYHNFINQSPEYKLYIQKTETPTLMISK